MQENKVKSSIIKDALALCLIALIAAVALGFVNEMTKGPIAELAAKQKAEAYQTIYPEAVQVDDANEELLAKVENSQAFLTDNGFAGVVLDEACIAMDASGNPIGYILTVTSKEGFGGDIQFSMGYTSEGTLTAIEILSISETAGLGALATEEPFKGQFAGRTEDSLTVVKSGAAEGEINAISGATITSNAVTKAVNAGIAFANDLLANGIGGVSHE
ncbi:MAG: RnfABCDGE type electron transport complex subunit G [Lachnospiraceae bacterium]|nr:RnfABCDGE type electron transport complex subunit G [Lachnospiraceae bacterium]